MINSFEKFILNVLKSPFKKFLMIIATLLIFFASLSLLGFEIVLAKMLPGKSANSYTIYLDTPTNSSIKETKKVADCVVGILQKEKEVTDVEVFLGQGAPLDYAGLVKGSAFKNSKNLAEIVVNLTSMKSRDETSFEMVHRIRPKLKTCQNLVQGSIIKLIEEPAGPPTLASVVAEIYSENSQGLRELAKKVAAILKDTKGLVDIDIMMDDIYENMRLVIDKEKIIRAGLSIEQVNNILYLAFEGSVVAAKNSPNYPEQIGLFVILDDGTKTLQDNSSASLRAKLSSLTLMNRSGVMIPLSELVVIKKQKSKPTIFSKNLKQQINVIAETDMVSQVYPLIDAKAKIIDELKDEYKVETSGLFNLNLTDKNGETYNLIWDGEMKVTLDTFVDLGLAFITALVLIFFLLVVYYKSFKVSLAILVASFVSLFGVILGHWIMDIATKNTFFLTATSLIGFIVLMGISSRNSMLLIDFAKLLITQGVSKKEAIAKATATRAKPIFLTAGTVVLASTMMATDPIFGGLGVALIFGTSAGVVVSLLLVPVLIDNIKSF